MKKTVKERKFVVISILPDGDREVIYGEFKNEKDAFDEAILGRNTLGREILIFEVKHEWEWNGRTLLKRD